MSRKMLLWAGLSALGVCSFSAGTLQAASAENEQAVNAAIEQFYVALNSMFTGDAESMEAVWSHADDVIYMGPGGELLVGWAQVRKSWQETAALKLGGKVEPARTQLIIGDDIAVACVFEVGENTNTNMQAQEVSIRASNVFRKEGGEWKMIAHHTDLLPFLEQ